MPASATRHRRSIRVPGYDYTQPGGYFVTIAAHRKEPLFSTIVDGEVVLSTVGQIVRGEWLRSADLRPEIDLDQFVVMPNHFHGIVIINEAMSKDNGTTGVGAHGRAPRRDADQTMFRPPRSLGSFIAGFKGAATARINVARGTPRMPVWQRNYYERIIRDEAELRRVRQYIADNPAKWADDPENQFC